MRAERTYGGRSLKAQMKAADKLGRALHGDARRAARPSAARSR